MTEFVSVALPAFVAAGPQRVWDALTATGIPLPYFHGMTVTSDWQPGSTITMRLEGELAQGDRELSEVTICGEVLAVDPPRRLSYTLGECKSDPTVYVTWELHPQEGRTLVRLYIDEPHTSTGSDDDLHIIWLPVLSALAEDLERERVGMVRDLEHEGLTLPQGESPRSPGDRDRAGRRWTRHLPSEDGLPRLPSSGARGSGHEGGTDVGPLMNRAAPWAEHTGDMTVRLPIGDFSRMTYLSVKSLRRYHDMGLLEPADIDRGTGHRYYDASQVPLGQAIRRFRDLEMPLEQLKGVLHAPDADTRNKLIIAHLEHMESALQQTQQTVASLRALLEQPHAPIAVEYRSVGAATAIAISEPVHMGDIGAWWSEAFDELHQVLAASSAVRAGPDGALYPNDFFEEELGEVVAFVPVAGMPVPSGRARLIEVPGAELAVTVHHGAISELDQTYGALGTFVAEREIGVQGPIREYYVVTNLAGPGAGPVQNTEVCWPIFRTKGATP